MSLCLASNFPINLIWGKTSHTQIINDGYRVVCGAKCLQVMGEDYAISWASAWPAIGDAFRRGWEGETSFLENQRMFLHRNGYLEETFFTFSLSPIRDETGAVAGLFHPVTEVTGKMSSERRARSLREPAAAFTPVPTKRRRKGPCSCRSRSPAPSQRGREAGAQRARRSTRVRSGTTRSAPASRRFSAV